MRSYRWRWMTSLAVLAALWAAIELSLGMALYALHAPLRGELLTALNLPLMFLTRRLIPRRGSVAALGCLAGLVRGLLGGGFAPQISVAIALEAALAELGLGAVNQDSRFRAALAGALAIGYTAVHPIFFWSLLMGGSHVKMPLGLNGWLILAGVVLLHMIGGACVGLWAHKLVGKYLNHFLASPRSLPESMA
jgi:hypothetical protein